MAAQTLTIGPTDALPKSYAVASVDSSDGLVVTVTSDTCGELWAWSTHAMTMTQGAGAAVPLPSASSAHAVPVRVWLRGDASGRANTVTLKAASSTTTVYLSAFPRASAS